MNIKGKDKMTSNSSNIEDAQLRKIAAKKKGNGVTIALAIVLLLLFLSTLYITLVYIDKYYGITVDENQEIITVNTKKGSATIINNGVIDETINSITFADDDQVIIENIDMLELEPEDSDGTVTFTYSVSYKIIENDFESTAVSSNSSPVLVKFSYSYDNVNWTYVNYALSTFSSNIMPLVNANYDISGLTGTISVATNYDLSATNGSKATIYWRSETIFQKTEDINEDKVFNANFSISYTSSK